MKIKVLVISNYNTVVSSRPEAEVLLHLQKRGMNISVITDGSTEYAQKFREAGMRVIDFRVVKKFDRKQVEFIRAELISGKYQILQLFNNKALMNGIRAAKGIAVKVVAYRGYPGNIHWYDPTAYLKVLHPRVDKIICLSEAVRQSLLPNLLFGKHKAVTIYKGHSTDWYKDVTPTHLSELNINPQSFNIICVANVRRIKGVIYMIEACKYLADIKDINLILVGDGMNNPTFSDAINKSGMSERIIITGFRKDVSNLIAAADVLVLPSLKEALSKVVLEAIHLRTAIVASDAPGNLEIIEHQQHGLIVPVAQARPIADAVRLLYNNREMMNTLKTNALEMVQQKFSIHQTVDKFEALYASCLA